MARKKKHEEHVNHERWLVSYADFITLLFAFFTTLYAISTVDQKKVGKLQYSMMTAFQVEFFPSKSGVAGQGSTSVVSPAFEPTALPRGFAKTKGKGNGNGFSSLAVKLEKLTESKQLKDRITVRTGPRGLVISLSEAGFFGSGESSVNGEAKAALLAVGEVLQSESEHIEVTIEGHTDDVPMRNNSNWALSAARATSVLELLLSRKLLDAAFVSAAGYGEHHPVASNATPEGRARNRRVDIVARARTVQVGG